MPHKITAPNIILRMDGAVVTLEAHARGGKWQGLGSNATWNGKINFNPSNVSREVLLNSTLYHVIWHVRPNLPRRLGTVLQLRDRVKESVDQYYQLHRILES